MANEIVTEILRTEENGIEYFTVVATGESAVSERGLAKMCGVNHKAIQYIFESLGEQKPLKTLENLMGQELYLANKIVKRGKDIKPVKASVAAKIIRYYDRKGKSEAQASFDAIAEIGLTHFIQAKTGWVPEQYKAAPQAHQQINRILDQPDPWKRLFEKEFCDRVITWFGHQFYWDFVYCWMTPDERCKLNQVNPVRKEANGRCDRLYRIHQFVEEETKDRLHDEVVRLIAWVEASTSREDFLRLYGNAKGMGKQLPLL